MDWQKLLSDLRGLGWTQQLLADRVGASQSAISDLNSGKTTNPAYLLGRTLEAMRDSKERPVIANTSAAQDA